ncbi:hypothetical protein QTG56_25855 (plasmid) [Rossellomorea sp. AcN35-11]|nr:hypothetical protein [Rossellomorea aquimaris]WJV32042.1 hypothetical protein QTG56_25855 [Rossellomorea sp. AcN35-11]
MDKKDVSLSSVISTKGDGVSFHRLVYKGQEFVEENEVVYKVNEDGSREKLEHKKVITDIMGLSMIMNLTSFKELHSETGQELQQAIYKEHFQKLGIA